MNRVQKIRNSSLNLSWNYEWSVVVPTWLGHWTFLCSFTSFFHFLSTSWLKAGRPGRAYFNWEGQHEQQEVSERVNSSLYLHYVLPNQFHVCFAFIPASLGRKNTKTPSSILRLDTHIQDKLNLRLPFCHLAPGPTETSSWASLWAARCWRSRPGGSSPPGPMLAALCRWVSSPGWPPSGPSVPRLPRSSGASG